MSQGEQKIVCRRCREVIPVSASNCPECGISLRRTQRVGAIVGFGLLLVFGAILVPGKALFFGVIGLALAATGGYVLYDKRKRINEASEQNQEQDVIGLSEETD